MCGRFSLSKNPKEVQIEEGIESTEDWKESFNIAPQQLIPGLDSETEPKPKLKSWMWGWQVPLPAGNKFVINARSETAAEKRVFAESYNKRRCAIPATGFYEWDRRTKEKTSQPYHFQRGDGKIFWLAGIWRQNGRANPPEMVMLTTAANEIMARIHHRLPVILDMEQALEWVHPKTPVSKLDTLCKPVSFKNWKHWSVSSEVNKVENNSPELLNPWKPPFQQLDLF